MQGLVRDDCRTADSVICAINDAIAERIGQQKFRIWFKNSTHLTLTDDQLKVGVANQFISTWLESHFQAQVADAARAVLGRDCRLVFAVDSKLTGGQNSFNFDKNILPAPRLSDLTPQTAGFAIGAAGPACQTTQTRPAQGRNLKLTFDSFVVGRSNELAYNAARSIVTDKQSPFNPLFIHGGYGLGKTHLLQGICNELRSSRPTANWLYLSAEDFANQFVLALKTRKLDAFRHRMRQTDLLAIDDIHFLASKPSTQEEFLYTFNTLDLAGRQVVLASDAHPREIAQLSEKLVNRFVSGMVVRIDTPDFKTRCEICRRYAGMLKKSVPEEVISYIADNLKRSIRELQGGLLKITAYASLQNAKIDLATARAAMAELIERGEPTMNLSNIESAVGEYFGITVSAIHSSKKDKTVALARHFCMFLARKHTRMSSSEIGRLLGDKNHATVLVGCKKIEEQIAQNAQLNWQGPTGNRVCNAKTILEQLESRIR
ncbi:MAG: chromosomal replication initiator protein DnaA [Sedimentisphaerales bacterium]